MVAITILFSLTIAALCILFKEAKCAEDKSYRLIEVKYTDLLSLEETALETVAQALTDVGALQITGIPRFALARKRGLEDLAECLDAEESVPQAVMKDGARRLSCGFTAKKDDKGTSVCGEASQRLRVLVDAGMRQLFLALDTYIQQHSANTKTDDNSFLLEPYRSFSDIFTLGDHLEHLHAYFAPTSSSAKSTAVETTQSEEQPDVVETMSPHVDAGLFIGMTVGYYSENFSPAKNAGLYIRLPDTATQVKVDVAEDALIVLAGQGASDWLNSNKLGKKIRAAPHALYAGLSPVSQGDATHPATRAWFGKMFLPPVNALVDSGKNSGEKITFEAFQKLQNEMSLKMSSFYHDKYQDKDSMDKLRDTLPAACGGAMRHSVSSSSASYGVSVTANSCATNEVWCWAQCMDASAVSPCGADQYLACYDYHSNSVVSGDSMCMGGDDDTYNGIYCRPTCVLNTSSVVSSDQFCYGQGTTMFMQGFQTMKTDKNSKTVDCVTLLFETWTLDSRVKFGFACVGVFLLAALTQCVPLLRRVVMAQFKDTLWARDLLLSLLFGADKTVGYFVMLVAMTYSVELFVMICLGLTCGFVVFHLWRGEPEDAKWGDVCCDDDLVWTQKQKQNGSKPNKNNALQQSLLHETQHDTSAKNEVNPCCAGTSEDF